MKAILVPVGEMPRKIEIDGLADLQKAVDGHIEPVSWYFSDEPTIYVDEEGKYTKRPNRALYATEETAQMFSTESRKYEPGEVVDILFGDFVAIGFDPDTGADRGLTDEEEEKVMAAFGNQNSIDSGIIEMLLMNMGTTDRS